MSTFDNLSRLDRLGFERITNWDPYEDRIKPRSLKWQDVSGWIYAFVADDHVRYIGMTTRILRSRLDNYAHQVGEPMRERVRECLNNGCNVEIYGLRRPSVGEAQIKAEESKLIAEFKPDWNVRE